VRRISVTLFHTGSKLSLSTNSTGICGISRKKSAAKTHNLQTTQEGDVYVEARANVASLSFKVFMRIFHEDCLL